MPIQLISTTTAPALTDKYVQCIFRAVQRCVRYPKTLALTVVAVNRAVIRQLNKQYRTHNQVTDVLSFAYDINYGEIVVCYPQAVAQAKQKQNPLQRELAWLVIHGILHVLGFDHDEPRAAKTMRSLETTILQYV